MNQRDLSENERLCIGAAIVLGRFKDRLAYDAGVEVAKTIDISSVDLEQVSPQEQLESVCLFMRKKVPGADTSFLCVRTKSILGLWDVTCRWCSRTRSKKVLSAWSETRKFAKAFYEAPYADPNEGVARAINFFNNVSEHGGVKDFYSKSVAIVQSFGSGKSRLIYELAARIPTIYVCLRKPDDTEIPEGSPVDLYNLIVGGPVPHIESRVPSKSDLGEFVAEAKDFHGFFHMQERVAFWETFRLNFETIRQTVYDRIKRDADLRGITSRLASYWDLIEEIARGVAEEYMHSWGPSSKTRCLNSIICIDEAQEFVRYESNCRIDTLSHMNRAARLLPRGSIFTFIDSLPDMSIMDPTYACPSSRASAEGTIQATLTDLVFWDLIETTEGIHENTTIFDTTTEWYMARFGRPVWGAALKTGYDRLLALAMAKLTNDKRIRRAELQKLAKIAVLASRTNIQVNPFNEKVRELVGSHMAYVKKVDSASGALVVAYPSDPVLSAAAQSLLVTGWRDGLWEGCLWGLDESLRYGLVIAEDRAQLAGQILCCCASDLCELGMSEEGGILVKNFLWTLIGDDALKAACSQEGLDQQATQCLLKGRVNFNHFIKVQGYMPNRGDLVRFLERRAAVVCKKEHWGVDLIIPVVLERPIEEISASAARLKSTTFPLPDNFEPFPIYKVDASGEPTETMIRCAAKIRAALSELEVADTESVDMGGEGSEASGEFTDSQNFYAKMSRDKPGTYILNADSVSYIIIKCETCNSGENRLPNRIGRMNPFSCGIEPPGREGSPRPYFAIRMLFDLKMIIGSSRHYELRADRAGALPRAGHEDQVKRYGVTRAVVNPHMLHTAMQVGISMLVGETPRGGGFGSFEAQDRLRMMLQRPLEYATVFEPKDRS